jgi:hypothetical protein
MTLQQVLISQLAHVFVRSLLLALVAAAVLCGLRDRRSPALSHAVWSFVLAGMLLLPALVSSLPAVTLRVLDPAWPDPVSPDFAALGWQGIVLLFYAALAGFFLLRVIVGAVLVHRLRHSAVPLEELPGVYESGAIAVPVTVGWLRPCILLPETWRTWEKSKLEAVLAHESAHVRRRDPLVTLFAALNRSLLWFHPLAWWIERRLTLLAEQACDEASIAVLGDRERYARLLLQMAGEVEAPPLWQAVSMAQPSHVRQRIERILEARGSSLHIVPKTWIAGLIAASLPVLYAAAALRLEHRIPAPPLPFPLIAAPSNASSTVLAQHAHQPRPPRTPAEMELASAVQRESNPRRKLALLDVWKTRFPRSGMEPERLQLYLSAYSQLNDVPNLLTALNQLGKQAFVKTLINPDSAETDFAPANLFPAAPAKVSQALFFYARAATYEGPGSLPVEGRQQLDEYLRKAYSSYYGQNEVGLNELKNLAKAMPFPPQAFVISVLPPPNRTFNSMLAAETSLIRIHNKCPYGLRIDCSGPERKRTWIPSGQDSQLLVASGTYQIYAADAQGVSSFTGPGRFDPQFDYAYTLTMEPRR